MTKFKTGFSQLNIATNGGLSTGGIFGIAAGTHTFKTGMALTLLKDIRKLNKPDTTSGEANTVILRTEESNQSVMDTLYRVTLGRRKILDKPNSNPSLGSHNWAVLSPQVTLTRNINEVSDIIGSIEEASRQKVRVLVFDHLVDRRFGDTASYFYQLSELCKKQDILGIVPFSFNKTGLEQSASPFPSTDSFTGVLHLTSLGDKGKPLTSLSVQVWTQETNKWGVFELAFKPEPGYGLISDITE